MGYVLISVFTDLSPEEEKQQQQELIEKFKPLLTWLKDQAGDVVRSGTNNLVNSCRICSNLYFSGCFQQAGH